jgi:hypothetical protein
LLPYWQAGQLLRQGVDPYAAELASSAQGTTSMPSNTAPMLLVLSALSFLSWPAAKTAWFVVNLVCVAAIPYMAMRLVSQRDRVQPWKLALTYLVFIGLLGTRATIGPGQTGLVVLFAMLLSLLLAQQERWILAGVALGFAVSKYSLAISVPLMLLLARNYRVLVVALVFQLVCMVVVAALAHVSPLAIGQDYVLMLFRHVAQEGIQLSYVLPQGVLADVAPAILTLMVLLVVVRAMTRVGLPRMSAGLLSGSSAYLFSLLMLWSLVVAYHKLYDTVVWIVVFAAILQLVSNPRTESLSPQQRVVATGLLVALVAVMSMPGPTTFSSLDSQNILTSHWSSLVDPVLSFAVVLSCGLCAWLLLRSARAPALAPPF